MKTINPLLCDPESGVCELPAETPSSEAATLHFSQKPVKIIYFTDPICSTCWGIEPQLRKLKLEYGAFIEIEYRMGGLLPDWSYNSGGISKPSDVAPHWDEVSHYYDMPIDGDVWLEDPLPSSYPPSIAFKAAQLQGETLALAFLRKIREMVFLEKKNITKWEHLATAASAVGVDVNSFQLAYQSTAIELFKEDLALGKQLGVRGFPSLFFVDQQNNAQLVYGFKPYQHYEAAVLNAFPAAQKTHFDPSWEGLFALFPTLTTKEFMELSGLSKQESETLLNALIAQQKLRKVLSKNGPLWVLN